MGLACYICRLHFQKYQSSSDKASDALINCSECCRIVVESSCKISISLSEIIAWRSPRVASSSIWVNQYGYSICTHIMKTFCSFILVIQVVCCRKLQETRVSDLENSDPLMQAINLKLKSWQVLLIVFSNAAVITIAAASTTQSKVAL